MDDADLAGHHDELMTKAHVYNSHKDVPDLVANGECQFCASPVEAGRRWCDADCRDDWELENL